MSFSLLSCRALTASLLILCAANFYAPTPAVAAKIRVRGLPPVQNLGAQPEVDYLKQVYSELAVADHDYKGHRAKAMKSIEAAVKFLGGEIRGDGKVREEQAFSDAQLRDAQAMLQQARDIVAGRNQKKVLTHIDTAIKELSIALTIR